MSGRELSSRCHGRRRLEQFEQHPRGDMQANSSPNSFGLPLTGSDKASIDNRGRIPVPKPMRDGLGEKFYVTLGRKGCLEAVSLDSFARIWGEILKHSPHSEPRQEYAAAIMSNSWQVEFDKTGRFVVPELARTKASLTGPVFLRSRGDAIEIWAEAEFEAYERDEDGYNKAIREKMKDMRRRMLEDGQE